MPRFRIGDGVKDRETGKVYVICAWAGCRGYSLRPVIRPDPASTTQFKPFLGPEETWSFRKADALLDPHKEVR